MSRWFSALCACLAFSPCLAIAQDAVMPYQPPSLRQVCEETIALMIHAREHGLTDNPGQRFLP